MRAQCVNRLRELLPPFMDLQRLSDELQKYLLNPKYGTQVEMNRLLESVEVLKLVERELFRINNPDTTLVPDATILQLLNLCETEMNQSFQMIKQRSTVAKYYDTWTGLVTEAREKRSANTRGLQKLTQTIMLDVATDEGVQEILPSSQHLNIQWSEKPAYEDYPFIAGVMVAQLAAYCIPQFPRGEDYVEVLASAALIHDVGLIPVVSGHHLNVKQLTISKTTQFKAHPTNGAIIAGRFKEMPVTFPYIIKQHHERMNGNGYPEKLIDKSLPPLSRALAILCRLTDLLLGSSFMHSPPEMKENKPLSLEAAAEQLVLEANLGELDPNLTGQFLTALKINYKKMARNGVAGSNSKRTDDKHTDNLAPKLGTPLVTSWSWQKHYLRNKAA